MIFKPLLNIISEKEVTYEISQDGTTRSISKNGVSRILKQNNEGKRQRVRVAGKYMNTYDLLKIAGWPPASWPEDERDWEELTFKTSTGFRYRIFEDSEVQSLNQYGNVRSLTHLAHNNGYLRVGIGKDMKYVHHLMGTVEKWFQKTPEWDETWTMHHKNNDQTNNHRDNLIWASRRLQREEQRKCEQSKINSYPVVGVAIEDIVLVNGDIIKKNENKQFDNSYVAMRMIKGGDSGSISRCINGILKTHAGFVWKTPQSDNDIQGEIFTSIDKNKMCERLVSNHGRVKYVFGSGYIMIKSSEDMITNRRKREADVYPRIEIQGKDASFHKFIVELFVGDIPENVVIDHINDIKTNAQLGNLQILTHQENCLKRHLKSYVMSVASFVDRKYEKTHDTKVSAINYIRDNGYPNATIEELENVLRIMTDDNIPAVLYGRTWIRAHFESYVKI
jgi:hypothetical protein